MNVDPTSVARKIMGNFSTSSDTRATSQQIRDFIAENFLFGDIGTLTDEDSLIDAGVLDSTGVVELVGFLEERFGITVDDQDMVPENLDSIARITAYVQRRSASR